MKEIGKQFMCTILIVLVLVLVGFIVEIIPTKEIISGALKNVSWIVVGMVISMTGSIIKVGIDRISDKVSTGNNDTNGVPKK